MKTKILVFLTASTVLFSCKKDSTSTAESMTCKIDGIEWVSAESFAEIALSTSITGTDSKNQKSFDLIVEDVTKGDYPLSDYTKVRFRDNVSLYEAVPGSGKISITEVTDKVVSGTFNFTVFQSGKANSEKVITNGVFKNITIEQ